MAVTVGAIVQIYHGGGYVKPCWLTIHVAETMAEAVLWASRYQQTATMTYEYRLMETPVKRVKGVLTDVNKSTNWQTEDQRLTA